ncbi:hypothetical protein G6F22_022071 [Rhizopus arrhizus]|nr:hypothetical protein G6F22_022071 [Rhizopus arrhizus]KAG1240316.1 hypothetical protein G6F68_017782 [Rhizopus microsporus]
MKSILLQRGVGNVYGFEAALDVGRHSGCHARAILCEGHGRRSSGKAIANAQSILSFATPFELVREQAGVIASHRGVGLQRSV